MHYEQVLELGEPWNPGGGGYVNGPWVWDGPPPYWEKERRGLIELSTRDAAMSSSVIFFRFIPAFFFPVSEKNTKAPVSPLS